MGYLTIFFWDSHLKELKNNDKKSKGAPVYDQPIARKSSSKLPVTSLLMWQGWVVTSQATLNSISGRTADRIWVLLWTFFHYFLSSFKWLSQKKWSSTPFDKLAFYVSDIQVQSQTHQKKSLSQSPRRRHRSANGSTGQHCPRAYKYLPLKTQALPLRLSFADQNYTPFREDWSEHLKY